MSLARAQPRRQRNLRVGLAVTLARAAGAASRALGKGGGTALPGLVAERVAPDLLRHLAVQLPGGAVVVTGTNGKTTTSHMLAAILERSGRPVLRNASGSNLGRGLMTALTRRADWTGRLSADDGTVAVFETDEAAIARAVPQVRPSMVVVTNLFRDQLDRYGEVDTVAAIWRAALEEVRAGPATGPLLVLNADDPTVAALAGPLPADANSPAGPPTAPRSGDGQAAGKVQCLYFGVEDARMGRPGPEHASDAKVCPVCGALLSYPVCFYGHVGHYACPNGHRRPAPDVTAHAVEPHGFEGTEFTLTLPAGERRLRLPLPGLYNVHNALAAAAAAHALGVTPDAIASGLAHFTAAFGRLERVAVDGRTLFLVLAKNPVGMNEALRTILQDGCAKHLLLALNDLDADGRDVSWIWDADFEHVAGHAASLVVAGLRADDLALRLKYAGVDAVPPAVPALGAALDAAVRNTPPGETIFAVLTYTAMLDLRRVLAQRGCLRAYWEGE